MNTQEIKQLQRVIDGKTYDARILRKALNSTNNLEYKICLKAEIANKSTFESRRTLDLFACELQQGISA